jgi:hypothetical protein
MIVIATRDDLRDEFDMADEAFALSPISARATRPSEEDYDAISEAFMETSRGRWFLGEYARRNRNADTRMVLDAVARIEESLAAQRQPAPDNGLAEALVAIRHALDEARAAASAALENLALEENLAPVRKGARVIREIAWRWREIGADSRICDLLDSQVSAIEGACGQISSSGPRITLSAAFDLIEARIAEFGETDPGVPQAAEEATSSPSPAPPDDRHAAVVATAQATSVAANDPGTAGNALLHVEAVAVAADAAGMSAEPADVTDATADAHDEALLDMIALEMAAPDPSDIADISDTEADQIHAAESPPLDRETIGRMPGPTVAPVKPPALQPALQSSPEPSLGASLIASGIVRRPKVPDSDPLAPIRRMSQAEKIAFFS